VIIDYGVRALKPAFASAQTASSSSSSPSSSAAAQPSTGPAGAEAMLAAATAASTADIPYSTSVQTSGLLAGFRADCSGFVSWLVNIADPSFGDQTTVTMPSSLQAGQGQYVTIWDRPQAGAAGHAIIEILGSWFESGGGTNATTGGGPTEITAAQADQEISGDMSPYHPAGL